MSGAVLQNICLQRASILGMQKPSVWKIKAEKQALDGAVHFHSGYERTV